MVECNTLMRIAEDDNDTNVTMCSATALGGAPEDVEPDEEEDFNFDFLHEEEDQDMEWRDDEDAEDKDDEHEDEDEVPGLIGKAESQVLAQVRVRSAVTLPARDCGKS